ncbi:LysR family transcriptional regulator [Nocardioides sp. GY 10127]|uniref:LysR family transcriptional regulator n=1 Tax=Nocardioides sp. GY 10127 TaxID=2569762 RepID=UPI0010A7DCB1|nr:LysR family transcriptional regulator [Nocardioides sp. GY 10127]TIC85616.1 LysR family transcriptional regulator [Nocardioides sp. GY 10127]
MDELETRELRYFVAVAEELHFGRAAARLSIAQPALSKTIQRVESRLKVQLLTRTSRTVALTPAGAALLEHGRHALDAVALALQQARRAGQDQPLRLVMKPGGDANLLSGILSAYAEQPQAHQVDILFSGGTDRTEHLREGRADVGLLYAPFDDLTGLAVETLHVEDRVAVLPHGHRLADRTTVRLDDLADETFPRWRGVAPDQSVVPRGVTTDTGPRSRAQVPEITDVSQLVPLVRIGRVVAILPRSLLTPTPAGIACVPVEDAEPSRIVIARNRDDDRPAVTALISAAVSAVPADAVAAPSRRRPPQTSS